MYQLVDKLIKAQHFNLSWKYLLWLMFDNELLQWTKHSLKLALPNPILTYSSSKSYILAGRSKTSFSLTSFSQKPLAPPFPIFKSHPFKLTNPVVPARGEYHSNKSEYLSKNVAKTFRFVETIPIVCASSFLWFLRPKGKIVWQSLKTF